MGRVWTGNREGMDFGSLETNSNILLFPKMEKKVLDFKVIHTYLKNSSNIDEYKLETETPCSLHPTVISVNSLYIFPNFNMST